MTQDIQIKYKNPTTDEWDSLDPVTNARIVKMANGESLQTHIDNLPNATDYYLKSETYSKEETTQLIDEIDTFKIAVSDTQPTENEDFWFEIL